MVCIIQLFSNSGSTNRRVRTCFKVQETPLRAILGRSLTVRRMGDEFEVRARVYLTDPLMCLPRKPIWEIGKGRVIYGPENPTDRLFLVVRGRVKVTTAAEGCETLARLLFTDDFFGEVVLVGGHSSETAVVLDTAMLMPWTRDEIEAHIGSEPRLLARRPAPLPDLPGQRLATA
jgi:hypothetical protein